MTSIEDLDKVCEKEVPLIVAGEYNIPPRVSTDKPTITMGDAGFNIASRKP